MCTGVRELDPAPPARARLVDFPAARHGTRTADASSEVSFLKYQLWYSESERSGLLLHDEDKTWPKPSDARVIWTVEANTYDEAIQKRDEFLERAGFAFASYSDPEAVLAMHTIGVDAPGRVRSQQPVYERTTRLTMCVHLDSDGNQQVFEMPGWIDNASQIEVRLAQARSGCSASAFIFVERPYGDLTSAPAVITVVDIHSSDGQSRMVQEFAGHIDDHALLEQLIKRRIGPGWTDWKPVQVHFMKRDRAEDSPEAQEDYLSEGTLHLIYTYHTTDSDFELIEADLNKVVEDGKRLAMVQEDVLTLDYVRQHFDPGLRDLPPEILFDRATMATKREALAAAYTTAVGEMNRAYDVWNALPAAQKNGVFTQAGPFHRRLLAWAADHRVEVVPAETSLEAWLTVRAWESSSQRVDMAMAKGESTTMWAANRKLRETVARATRLRDADANAQIARLLKIERRGHNVLYVVGAAHSVNESVLICDLKAATYEKRFRELLSARIEAALLDGTFDDQPIEVRERLETIEFLNERLSRLARRATPPYDYYDLIDRIEQAAVARNFTLRQIVDDIISIPAFQEAARTTGSVNLGAFFAWAFVKHMISDDYISLAETQEYLPGPWR